jgi:carboxymethylenebutenolidase
MVSQAVTVDVAGAPMPGYLARPDDAMGPRPAVIVLQEIFGVNTEVKRITDLLGASGYVALAINYYHRTDPELNEPYTPEGMQNGFRAAAAVTKETLRADVGAAIDWLNEQPFVAFNHIATWGFCFGGAVAFVTATLRGISGAICFYGGSIAKPMPDGEPPALADAAEIRCPLLLVYGGKDEHIPASDIEQTQAALTAAHKEFEVQVYPDQGHAFFRDSGSMRRETDAATKSFVPDAEGTAHAVADAWDLVEAFLSKHLQ